MEEIKKLFNSLNLEPLETIKVLSNGLNNENYVINSKYCWKKIKNSYLFDTHQNEKDILEKDDKYTLYYSDDTNICFNFIKGSNLNVNEFRNEIQEITKVVKEFHLIQIITEKFWEVVIPQKMKLLKTNTSYFNELNILYNKITTSLSNFNNIENDLCLCHHDIHGDNILKYVNTDNNQVHYTLIDLEFAFTNYYFVDIANLLCEMYTDYHGQVYTYENIKHEDKLKILKSYFNIPNNNNDDDDNDGVTLEMIEKLDVGIDVSHFYWAYWGFLLDEQEQDIDFDYKKFANSRLHQLKLKYNV